MSYVAFTSIAANYLPKARVLARSLKKHHPEIRFCLLVGEPIRQGPGYDYSDFDEVATLEDLGIPQLKSWIFKHSLVELCTAIKGPYLEKLLQRPGCDGAFYFDPDMAVFGRLDPLFEALQRGSVALTPHQLDAEEDEEAVIDNELCSLKHGVYNLGFIGVRPSHEGLRFAAWWRDRLESLCYADIPRGIFTDQRWVDLAPALFSGVEIIRDRGCNVATWNLTHRLVEGEFDEGFTVNGKPLRFYHFSGFDSGAQEVMLKKYGRRMPAAFLLRSWYIEQCRQMGDESFDADPWLYSRFDNGEAVTTDHRLVYRNRLDLQKAYPDPFATGPHSFFQWYKQRGAEHHPVPASISSCTEYNVADLNGEPSPLSHYVKYGAKRGLTPCRSFDPDHYLSQNAVDVGAQFDPLSHYLRVGARDLRDPHPRFDARFYALSLPRDSRAAANALLHYQTDGRRAERRTSGAFDAAADIDVLRALRAWRGTRPLVLMLSHYGGGGTEKHVREFPELVPEGGKFLLLHPVVGKRYLKLATLDKNVKLELTFDLREQCEDLIQILLRLGIDRLHIHHLFGNELFVSHLVDSLDVPFDLTLHDYFLLSPNPHLTLKEGRYAGVPTAENEEILLATSLASPAPDSIDEWRKKHRWLVDRAARVIAPSHDVARRFMPHFPAVEFVVAAHPESWEPSPVKVQPLEASERLRIAVFGELSPHKGAAILLAASQLADEHHLPITFELIGSFTSHTVVPPGNKRLVIHGAYSDKQLPELIAKARPHLAWFPAQWPETYSYTLSACLKEGLPLVVPDIGAFAERVVHRPWSWIEPWDYSAKEWVDRFLEIRKAHFQTGQPPPLARGEAGPPANFYSDGYLKADVPHLAMPGISSLQQRDGGDSA